MMRSILDLAGAKRVAVDESTRIGSYEIELEPEPERVSERMKKVLRGAAETMALTIRRLAPPSSSGPAPTSEHEPESSQPKGA